jgi:hypothetical protein
MAETKYKRGKEIFTQLEKQLEYREGVPEYQLKYAQYITESTLISGIF